MLDPRAYYVTLSKLVEEIDQNHVFNFYQKHIEMQESIDKQTLLREFNIAQTLCRHIKKERLMLK